MKLGIIATIIDSPKITGVEKYAIELIRYITRKNKDTIIFCHPQGREIIRSIAPEVELVVSPFENRIITDQVWVPWSVRCHKIEFIYNVSLAHPFVGFGDAPFIFMLHDATPWRYPKTTSKGMRFYYLPQIRLAISSMRLVGVITNSVSSQQEICKYCDIELNKIFPIHLGIDHQLFSPKKDGGILTRILGNIEDYVLIVGTIEPRKNLVTGIRAFEKLVEKYPTLSLVVVGRKGWLESLDIPVTIRDRIIFTGYISDQELVRVYSGAILFVFPTIYEGFGLPLLEAMACGVPVVASNTSSLPEIGLAACQYADPFSVSDFAEKIDIMLSSKQLRESFIESGLKRAKLFNWDSTVNETWSIIQSLFERFRNEG